MKHIMWVSLLAALSTTVAMISMTGSASARNAGCPDPCYFPDIDAPLQWVLAGKTTQVKVVAHATSLPKVTVSLSGHSPLLSLVKSRSTKYALVKGVPTWTIRNIRVTKGIHFVFLVRRSAPAGKRMTYTVKTATVLSGMPYTTANTLPLHVAKAQ
jgi:hypothetical protein